MGYYGKTSNYLDLAELENASLRGLTNRLTRTKPTEGETIFDLSLGGRSSDSGNSNSSSLAYRRSITEHRRFSSNSMESSLPSSMPLPAGSSKRGRGSSSGANQVVSCLVDGCNSDLSKCRDYHRRHKVCEQHSKTPRVTIAGLEQRFCQQCSRFHSLGEFDEGKRSCRKRLEGHNRRRRKPQPESLAVNPATFLSASQGSRFLPNNNSSIIPAPTSVVSNSTWSVGVKTVTDTSSLIYSSIRPELNVLPNSPYNFGKQFPFLQDSFPPLPLPASTHQLFHDDLIPTSGNSGTNNPINFLSVSVSASSSPNCELNQVMNSDCALSLLSSSPTNVETTEICLGGMMQQSPNSVPTTRPLITGLQYNSFMGQFHHHHGQQGLDDNIHGAIDGAPNLISNVFQPAGSDVPSSCAPCQKLSFSWA